LIRSSNAGSRSGLFCDTVMLAFFKTTTEAPGTIRDKR